MRIKDYLLRTLLFVLVAAVYVMAVSCSEEDAQEINLAPELSNVTVNVSESLLASEIITVLSATDAEGDDLVYTITTDEDGLFEINTAGELSLLVGQELDYETKTSHVISVSVSDGVNQTNATVTINVSDIADAVAGISAANFSSYNTSNNTSLIAHYYFDKDKTPTIDVEGYNEDYTYELHLKGLYLGEEYTVALTHEDDVVEVGNGDVGKGESLELASTVSPDNNSISTTETLEVDTAELDFDVDAYTATIMEVESGTEIEVTSADYLVGVDANYKTYVVDNDATNFLSGTQIENYSDWSSLTELNLNDATQFRVRPTIVNYINGIALVLGVYDLDANKIGYITSNGSNGSVSNGTYSYIFNTTKLDDLITENGEYLLRLEERTSTIDADDTGYRNALFQKINITKIEANNGPGDLIAVEKN